MALHLHSNESSECPIKEARQLVSSWLPHYGYQESQTNDILSSIATRTGILVSGGNSNFIFVQFGLQEYFASLGVIDNYGVEAVAKLQPKQWWREAILLAAAQQRDPTPLLEPLFVEDPLLGAAAVAECPTPSTAMQSQAVAACLNAIDAKDKAVSAAVVPLLRKLTGQQEAELCSSLEKRLNREDEVASLVGIALATTGTAAATTALGRHPEVWDKCLSEAGYLSASFENMLVDWIQKGNEFQSNRAAELISGRLSHDRFMQLVKMLPDLPSARRDKLASLLLLQLETKPGFELYGRHQFYPFHRLPQDFALWVVSQCAPHITDREVYLKRREAELTERHGHYGPFFEVGDMISTALYVENRSRRSSSEELLRLLTASVRWGTCRSALFCWLFSGMMFFFIPASTSFWWIYFLLLGVVVFLSHHHRMGPPWLGHIVYFGPTASIHVTLMLMLASVLLVTMFGGKEQTVLNSQVPELSHLGVVLLMTLIGLAIRGPWERFEPSGLNDGNNSVNAKFRVYSTPPISFAVLVAATGLGKMFLNLPAWWAYVTAGASVILMGVALYLLTETAYSARIVTKASRTGAQLVSKFRRE